MDVDGYGGQGQEPGDRSPCGKTGERAAWGQLNPLEACDAQDYPTLAQIGLLCLVVVGLVLLSSVAVEVLMSWRVRTSSIKPSLIGLIISEGMMLSSVLLLLRVRHMSATVILRLRPVALPVLGASLLLGVSWSVLVGEIDSLIQRLIPIPEFISRMFADLTAARDVGGTVLVFVAVVLLPGICEEAFFRGVVLAGFAGRWGTWSGILTSSLLFALLHFNPWQFVPLFLVGALLGYLVLATHSLYPAILAHSANNLLSWVSMSGTARVDYQVPIWLVLFSALVFAIGLRTLKRARGRVRELG